MIEVTTPKGIASKVYLVHPDTKFDSAGKYRLDLTLKVHEATDLVKICTDEAINTLGPKKAPLVKMPHNENKDGTVTLMFKSKAPPNLYDSKANLMDREGLKALRIGDGSTVRVNGAASAYEGFGGGVTLYLLEVQIIHRVGGGFEPDASGSFIWTGDR
ncbi:hypothetical protein [Paraburkholderia phenoliruptrix]|uniref:hypothetical protein n=1 Tax=Paraburkholderia phenoliruptrix TaxID=252970 RepID=UPI003D9686AE